MATPKVTLVLDEGDAGENPVTCGSVRIVPSQRLPDPADQLEIGQAPVRARFGDSGPPSVELVPNDLIGPQQPGGNPGWSYTIYYDGVPGDPEPWSFWVLWSDGPEQRLSDLAEAPVEQAGQRYLPLSGGTLLGAVAPSAIILADALVVPVDARLGNDFTLPMTAQVGPARRIGAAVPVGDRQNIAILLVQPASGGPCGVTWDDAYNFGSSGPPVLSSVPASADLAAFKFEAGLGQWLFLGTLGGYR